jgi:hypothetical protein
MWDKMRGRTEIRGEIGKWEQTHVKHAGLGKLYL